MERETTMKKSGTKKSTRILCLAMVLLLVSCIGASLVQTNFGKVTMKDLRWETASGHEMSALLFVPEGATAEHPAPAIVTSHGWYNNREMQDLNYVEYARRGYVVMSIDMYGHGNSDNLPAGDWWKPENGANGMYDAVKLMATLPYVDTTRIGVTGHSNGALASRQAVLLDNEAEQQLISAVLLVSNDAIYTDKETGAYVNVFGSRDVGVVACQYDEFFHRTKAADGSKTAPRDYIHQSTAQSFLYFGTDPAGQPERAAYELHKQEIDGSEAIRVIYNPAIIHPWAHFSAGVVTSSQEFFDAALGAPNMIAPSSQIWQVKVAFNALGLVGFVMFAVGLALCLLNTKFFGDLKATEPVLPAPAPKGKGLAWFWGGLGVGTLFSMLSYMFIYKPVSALKLPFFNQAPVLYIGVWSLVCGLFTLLTLFLSYRLFGKQNGVDLAERGVAIGWRKLGKTVVLAVLVAAATYGTVFLADYFFKADFRIWCLTIKAFTPDKLLVAAKFLPFFLLFYIINSVGINSFNYVKLGKHDWVNTAVVTLFNALSPAILIIWIYASFFSTGFTPMELSGIGGSIIGIWLFPVVIVLPVAAFVSRVLYKATKNPYLSGIIMAILVTLMSCTNTLTLG
ncbi:MAG: acetylxylan esterase [Pseudoflavonifractor sp.]